MHNCLIFGAGLVLLVGGGELMIRGAVLKAGKISRAGGLVLVSLYVAYMVALF